MRMSTHDQACACWPQETSTSLLSGKKPPSEMVASIQQHKCIFALFILLKLTSNDVFLQNIYTDLLIMNIFQIIHLFMK